MVKLTDKQQQFIKTMWVYLDMQTLTAQALARLFAVYPWTTRLFKNFRGCYESSDPVVLIHAQKVQSALCMASMNLESIVCILSEVSRVHQEIGVDNQNVKLLGQAFIVELALHYQKAFGPEEHDAAYKFFELVAEALSSNYH